MKSVMSFMENLDVTKFIKLMNYAYSGFHFCRKKSECFGVNVHDGKLFYFVYFFTCFITLTIL